MRTPYALSPWLPENVTEDVEVVPAFAERVTGTEVVSPAVQVQKSVDQTSVRLLVLTQESDKSSRKGQHVIVVMVLTPLVSWHAETYPDGHMTPGEKYEVGSTLKPDGRQDVMGSTMKISSVG